jgi:hypothetical protein
MRKFLYGASLLLLTACGATSAGDRPTEADVRQYLKRAFEKEATSYAPRTEVTLNSVQFGETEESNYNQQLNGVPKGAAVTHAKIDYTKRTYYSSGPKDVRIESKSWVYKDQFQEWICMSNGMRNIE